MAREPDAALMDRLTDGDTKALALLYDRYGGAVYALAHRMLRDKQGAEDLVQEVFVKVWRASALFRPERGRFLAWLLQIAHTTAVDVLRRRNRSLPMTDVDGVVATGPSPEEEAERAVIGEQVRGALMRLPPEQRQVLELAYYEGLTHQEIARLVQIPLGTVKSRLRLGLVGLRRLLMRARLVERAVSDDER